MSHLDHLDHPDHLDHLDHLDNLHFVFTQYLQYLQENAILSKFEWAGCIGELSIYKVFCFYSVLTVFASKCYIILDVQERFIIYKIFCIHTVFTVFTRKCNIIKS